MKVIVAGGREFDDYDLLCKTLNGLKKRLDKEGEEIIVVSGTARGADKLGERWAILVGVKIERYPADWSQGKAAGYIRNKEMAENADALVAFHDGESKGTKHMIDLAMARNLKVKVVHYKKV